MICTGAMITKNMKEPVVNLTWKRFTIVHCESIKLHHFSGIWFSFSVTAHRKSVLRYLHKAKKRVINARCIYRQNCTLFH